jgi:hypothetical protein
MLLFLEGVLRLPSPLEAAARPDVLAPAETPTSDPAALVTPIGIEPRCAAPGVSCEAVLGRTRPDEARVPDAGAAAKAPGDAGKPWDPAPMCAARLASAFGTTPNYLARERGAADLACDPRSHTCDQFHRDLARIDQDASAGAIVGSAAGTAIGLGAAAAGSAGDRELAPQIKFRGKARFVGIVIDW